MPLPPPPPSSATKQRTLSAGGPPPPPPEATRPSRTESLGKAPNWVEVQAKAYLGWINTHLIARNLKISDLIEDLKNGHL